MSHVYLESKKWVCATNELYSGTFPRIGGLIEQVRFIPGTGASLPLASYDVVLTDENGVDLLMGVGASVNNASTVTTNYRTPLNADSQKVYVKPQSPTLTVSNAGSLNSGEVEIAIRQVF